MAHLLDDAALDALFRTARTRNGWENRPLTREQINAIYDLTKWGPTSANLSPARFVFVESDEGKAKLAACVSAGNAPKVLAASVTVIIGMDLKFAEKAPQLFPHEPSDAIRETAFRNSTLQGGYLMMAARALGLDCGPMSGFDKAKVDAGFFAGTSVEANFICAIGYGTEERLFPRLPRLAFDEACQIV
jgi:nitroreductase